VKPPLVVLVHGAGCDHHVWDALCAVLACETLPIDLPGRQRSEETKATAHDAAAAIVGELSSRGHRLEDVVVVGHSYGGAVAIECALMVELAGLVLISTGARLRVHPDVLAAMPERSPDVPADTARVDWLAADAFDRMADVARITAPTLVIGGTRDDLTPRKYADYLAARIRGAELVRLANAGHMCITEDAPRVAAAIQAFLPRCGILS
jgi:pimeloyl-ACP methyl ester carboxylesterase